MKLRGVELPAGLTVELHGYGGGAGGEAPTRDASDSMTRLAWNVVQYALDGSGVPITYSDINADPERTARLEIQSWPVVRLLVDGQEVARSQATWFSIAHFHEWFLAALARRAQS